LLPELPDELPEPDLLSFSLRPPMPPEDLLPPELPDELPEPDLLPELPDELPEPDLLPELPDELPEPDLLPELPDELPEPPEYPELDLLLLFFDPTSAQAAFVFNGPMSAGAYSTHARAKTTAEKRDNRFTALAAF